jgi:hypothetical protein
LKPEQAIKNDGVRFLKRKKQDPTSPFSKKPMCTNIGPRLFTQSGPEEKRYEHMKTNTSANNSVRAARHDQSSPTGSQSFSLTPVKSPSQATQRFAHFLPSSPFKTEFSQKKTSLCGSIVDYQQQTSNPYAGPMRVLYGSKRVQAGPMRVNPGPMRVDPVLCESVPVSRELNRFHAFAPKDSPNLANLTNIPPRPAHP